MWALALFVLSLFGLVLINLFGNITVTNQLNYTTMKNTVEAAMYDSLDIAHYRTGFCVCTNNEKVADPTDNKLKWVFKSSDEYEISDVVYDGGTGTCSSEKMKNCELVEGEYKIMPDTFTESLVRRFAEVVNNNKDYQIVIQDIIEYPPKVSIRINSNDEQEFEENGEFTISNQIDAIIETKGKYKGTEEDNSEETIDDVCENVDRSKMTPCNQTVEDKGDYILIKTTYCYKDKPCDTDSYRQYKKTEEKETTNNSEPGGVKNDGCFLAGTKIVIENGYEDIDKLKIGDYILTYNEEKGINEYKKVSYVFVFNDLDEILYTIKTDDTEMRLTHHHRVYTYRDGKYQYLAAENLNIGDVVRYSNGEYHKIKEISHRRIGNTVYNLEVEDNHNFYVGNQGILVHNAGTANNNLNGNAQALK